MKYLKIISAITFYFVLSGQLFSQRVSVTEILDGNLFKLRNGRIIRLSEIYIPTNKDIDNKLSGIESEIKEWSMSYFKNRYFNIKYDKMLSDSTWLVYLFRPFNIGEEEDVATAFLKRGYAAYIGKPETENHDSYFEYETKAKDSKTGIWSLVPADYFSKMDSSHFFAAVDARIVNDKSTVKKTDGGSALRTSQNPILKIYKDPTLAGILSFITPGLGQIYSKDAFKGILFFGGTALCYSQYISSIQIENSEVRADVGYLIAGLAVHIR